MKLLALAIEMVSMTLSTKTLSTEDQGGRETRRLHSSLSGSYGGWCACSQTEVKRSRVDGEGWLEWIKHAASSSKETRPEHCWQRKGLEFGAPAVQVDQCTGLSVNSVKCQVGIVADIYPHFHKCASNCDSCAWSLICDYVLQLIMQFQK